MMSDFLDFYNLNFYIYTRGKKKLPVPLFFLFFLDNYPFRDIDIAIYVDQEKINSQQAFDYSFQLSLDLSKEKGFEIDIQVMNYAPLGFRHSVFKNGKLLFSKDENLRLNLIESASLEYIDFFELSLQYIHDIAS